jgi:hypothetical protein
MSIVHLQNDNLAIETTRKKAIQVMQKGIISYKLACLGWDISDHYGDGYDLLCINTSKKTPHIVQLELKGVDINFSKESPGFSQSLSPNEISTASHLIVSVFDGIRPLSHHIMTLNQMFMNKKTKTKSTKFSIYDTFSQYREDAIKYTKIKVSTRKGQKNDKTEERLNMDIGCTPNQSKNEKWFLQEFKNQWKNLMLVNEKEKI